MAAHLVPGGRIINYDPQTYATYPDSPQGIPDLNILAGLPSVSGYASIVNGTYETMTHTHEQGRLDILPNSRRGRWTDSISKRS